MLKYYMAFLLALLIGAMLSFPILKLCKKFHLSQTILHYVDKHTGKSGTPTMGGTIFIFAILISSIFFLQGQIMGALMALVTMIGYGLLGFLDDFIKVKFHKNEGLKPYQKIIGQVGISLIIGIFVYNYVGSSIAIPFTTQTLDLGIFIIPFIILFFVALVNSVNLIDGLDGLCGGVNIAYLVGFSLIVSLILNITSGSLLIELQNLQIVSYAVIGSLFAFLIFNGYPACIFMGDTGSLALGGFLSSIAVFSGLELYVLILGLPFVLTSLSDIIQVLYYKKTKKRIFLMAPLHHHFEKKGFNENKIVIVYTITTLFIGVLTYLILNLII